MAAKKINLAPDVKSRLRRAVLGGIDAAPAAASRQPVKTASAPAGYRPSKKTLNKIVVGQASVKPAAKPLLLEYKPARIAAASPLKASAVKQQEKNMTEKKIAMKKTKPAAARTAKASRPAATAKIPLKPAVGKPVKPAAPAVPSAFGLGQKVKPLQYKPFAAPRRDWEKPRKEESLEKLFRQAEKSKPIGSKSPFAKFNAGGRPASGGSMLWLKVIGVVVLLAALFFGYMALGIYRYGFNGPVSSQTAKILNLPAGSVDGSAIGVGEYLDGLKLLAQPMAANREGLIDYSGRSDLSDRIFYRLAANELINGKIKAYGKTVSPADVDAQVAMLIKQTGGQAQAEEIIRNLYGFNLSRFRSLVLQPMLARANLQAAIIEDESLAITKAAGAKAVEVLGLAMSSTTDFAALAKQYSDDEASINTGGDLGWVVKGQLDPTWESAIFTAATGTVVSRPIRSDFGYHIIKVDQKLQDKDTGAESVKLRHILIRIDVDEYIRELLASAKIVKFVR